MSPYLWSHTCSTHAPTRFFNSAMSSCPFLILRKGIIVLHSSVPNGRGQEKLDARSPPNLETPGDWCARSDKIHHHEGRHVHAMARTLQARTGRGRTPILL